MRDLIPIGRFAELTGLTIKALRLYDERGLLQPALVAFESGRRYYSADQIDVGRQIRMLRATEMPLEEIRQVLAAQSPAIERERLAGHRQWVEERIEGYRGALRLLHELEQAQQFPKEGAMESNDTTANASQQGNQYRCSFCGKKNDQIERMIAGPNGVFICNRCVDLCNEIIAKSRTTTGNVPR